MFSWKLGRWSSLTDDWPAQTHGFLEGNWWNSAEVASTRNSEHFIISSSGKNIKTWPFCATAYEVLAKKFGRSHNQTE